EPFLGDLPDLEGDERAERLLHAAQLLAEEAHELAALARRYLAALLERRDRARNGGVGGGGVGALDAGDLLAGDRRAHDEVAAGGGVDAETLEQLGRGSGRVDGRHWCLLEVRVPPCAD